MSDGEREVERELASVPSVVRLQRNQSRGEQLAAAGGRPVGGVVVAR